MKKDRFLVWRFKLIKMYLLSGIRKSSIIGEKSMILRMKWMKIRLLLSGIVGVKNKI